MQRNAGTAPRRAGRFAAGPYPHWAGKPEVQQTETAELKNALIADGFDPNDVSSIADARLGNGF